jgi:hypothetical protein
MDPCFIASSFLPLGADSYGHVADAWGARLLDQVSLAIIWDELDTVLEKATALATA